MNDGTERVTGWPRITFAQSAQAVENFLGHPHQRMPLRFKIKSKGDFGSVTVS